MSSRIDTDLDRGICFECGCLVQHNQTVVIIGTPEGNLQHFHMQCARTYMLEHSPRAVRGAGLKLNLYWAEALKKWVSIPEDEK